MIPSCKTSYPDWGFHGFTLSLHANTGTVPQSRPWQSPISFVPHHYTWQQAITEAVTSCSLQKPRFDPKPVHVGYVMDNVALEHVFSEYFGFPCMYHSISALYAYFIHIPLTQCILNNWANDSINKQNNYVTTHKHLAPQSTLHVLYRWHNRVTLFYNK